jgi:general secretion pathway protein C
MIAAIASSTDDTHLRRIRGQGMGRALSESGERPAWVARATFVAEAVAVAALAYLLARLVISPYPALVETPLGLSAGRVESAARTWTRLDPFRQSDLAAAAEAAPVEAPATTLNLALVGVRAEGGGQGSAIIQTPDNQQKPYVVGDIIVDGATLAAVDVGFVTIRRADGATESLRFAERASLIGASSAPVEDVAPASQAAAPPVAGAVNVEALLADIMPYQRAQDGLVVTPAGNGVAFAAAGLQAFDEIRRVNGVGLSRPEDWRNALAGVGPGSTVTVEALRGGDPVTFSFIVE